VTRVRLCLMWSHRSHLSHTPQTNPIFVELEAAATSTATDERRSVRALVWCVPNVPCPLCDRYGVCNPSLFSARRTHKRPAAVAATLSTRRDADGAFYVWMLVCIQLRVHCSRRSRSRSRSRSRERAPASGTGRRRALEVRPCVRVLLLYVCICVKHVRWIGIVVGSGDAVAQRRQHGPTRVEVRAVRSFVCSVRVVCAVCACGLTHALAVHDRMCHRSRCRLATQRRQPRVRATRPSQQHTVALRACLLR
jgi:hypothetical protein